MESREQALSYSKKRWRPASEVPASLIVVHA